MERLVVAAQEGMTQRHLGSVVLTVRNAVMDLSELVPNPSQPRLGPKDDPELRKSILENNGLFEPLLVEPHPKYEEKYQIIDGERRWYNCKVLVEIEKKEQFGKIPVQVCDRTLEEDERLRAWVTIHMQRKEWSAKEKERTAYRLIELVGRVKAANIFGVTVKQIDRLKETYELSERMTAINNPDASITYAREIMNLPLKLRDKKVEDAIVKKVNERIIVSSKQIRELRSILRNPLAKEVFLKDGASVDDAKVALPNMENTVTFGQSLIKDIQRFNQVITTYPWPRLLELKGQSEVICTVRQCKDILENIENLLKSR